MGFYDLLHLAGNYNNATVTSDTQAQYQFFFMDNVAILAENRFTLDGHFAHQAIQR